MISIERQFLKFHSDNPHVYDLFLHYARMVKRSGFDRFSAKAIYERMRWHYQFETKDDYSSFRINNNYTAYYARKAMDENKDLINFFETREKRNDK